jgi:hypothetical protein
MSCSRRRTRRPGCRRISLLSRSLDVLGDGGARRDRTDDLMLAKHALYQLSYGPILGHRLAERRIDAAVERCLVGPGRLELPTLRLSGVRSNHLSYGPPKAPGFGIEHRLEEPRNYIRAPAIGTSARDRIAGLGSPRGRPAITGKRNEDGGVPHLFVIGEPIRPVRALEVHP